MNDPDTIRTAVEHALAAGQPINDIDMVLRARYAYEWGGGDALHLELANEVERLRAQCATPAAEAQDWPAGAPRAWLLPTGVSDLMPGPCLAVEGNPNTFIAYQASGGWGSFSKTHLPDDARPLIPLDDPPAGRPAEEN